MSLRSQGPLTPKVLTAGWVRGEMKHFLFSGEPSETSAGGQVELLLPHSFLTGADSAQSTRCSIVHPVGSGTKKPLCWAELLWVAES